MKGEQSRGMNSRKPRGDPQKTWIQQISNETPASWRQMWQSADERGHVGIRRNEPQLSMRHDNDDDGYP